MVHKHNQPTEFTSRVKNHINPYKCVLFVTVLFSIYEEEKIVRVYTQSRQSAKLFLQSSELGLPQPLTRRRVCPTPRLVPGGGAHTLARQLVGESQFRRGAIHCGTL